MEKVKAIVICVVSKGNNRFNVYFLIIFILIWILACINTTNSGFFWRHPLVLSLNLEYYWRVEPDVRYFCDLDYDPFLYMKQNKKKYGT